MGVMQDVPVLSSNSTIDPGAPVSWNNVTIGNNVVVTVPKGATLVIDGVCYNNGTINVDGGSLIIRSVLDSSVGETGSAGSVTASGGLVLVEDTGVWLTRNEDSSFSFSDHSHIDIQGVAVFSSGLTLSDSEFFAGYGSVVCVGVIPNSTVSQTSYTKTWVANNKTEYLDALCSLSSKTDHKISLCANSSLQSCGIFFVNPLVSITETALADNFINANPYTSIYKSSNISASIQSMMLQW